MSFKNFSVEYLDNETKFKQTFCETTFIYKQGANQNNESKFLSFYLNHLLTHNQKFEGINQYIANLEISNPIKGEYLISSKFYRGPEELQISGTGRGAIFRIDEGLEIFYQEKIDNSQPRKIHYQYLLEEFTNGDTLLKTVNCETREVVDCFLFEKKIKIEDAEYLELKDNEFKCSFKTK